MSDIVGHLPAPLTGATLPSTKLFGVKSATVQLLLTIPVPDGGIPGEEGEPPEP